jgi:pimeloyl-ACP methyl ester carboxylesterase
MLQISLHILSLVLLIYCLICVVYFFIQEKFIFVPTLPGEPFESKLAVECEEFSLTTPHNGSIHALLLKVDKPKGVVIYLHGNTGSLKRWQFMAEEISGYELDVFVPDYRGYGKSKGRRSEAFMHRDMEYCFDLIRERYSNQNIIIYGRSLGCAFACRLASRREAHMLILETPFYNMIETGKYYLPFLPVKYLLRYKFRSDIYLQHIDCPIHILHGTRDIIVPHDQALKLYRLGELHNREITMTTIVGGKHGNLNGFPLFREKLEQFFQSLNKEK